LGSDNGPSSALGQGLTDGAVTAYIRSWNHQPSNGDAVVIFAFEFKTASDESSFVDGIDNQMRSQVGAEPLAVAGVPGASGADVHTSTSGTASSEYIVSFEKGNTAFQVVVATSSGDLTSADAVSVADQQYASAPDIPASGSATSWHLLRVVPLVGLLLCIAIIVFGRMRKYPEALRGLPSQGAQNWGPPVAVPSGPPAPYSFPVGPAFSGEPPKVSADQWQ